MEARERVRAYQFSFARVAYSLAGMMGSRRCEGWAASW